MQITIEMIESKEFKIRPKALSVIVPPEVAAAAVAA